MAGSTNSRVSYQIIDSELSIYGKQLVYMD